MDYKLIVILLVLLFLIVLIYREITTLKDQVDKNIMTISSNSKQTNDRYESTLQHNMDKYLSQIKNISTDNLQQLKKITLLNHQPIIKKKTSNHFTETNESDARSENSHLKHFSDVKGTNQKIFDNQTNSYYYSDRVGETKNSDYISNNAEQSPKQKTDYKCDNDIPIYEEEEEETSSVGSYSVTDSENSDENSNNNTNDNQLNYQISQQFISQQMENSINSVIMNAQQFAKPFINTVLNEQQHMFDALKTKINNATMPMFQSGIVIHIESDMSDESGEHYNNVESISSGSINIKQQVCNSQFCVIPENTNTIVGEQVVEEKVVEEIVVENKVEEPIVENKVEETVVEPIVENKAEETVVEPIVETVAVVEPEIHIISKKPPQIVINTDQPELATRLLLKSINEYTLNDLKAIAKQLSIPTTYKHQNKIKPYKKEDLYNNIKIKY